MSARPDAPTVYVVAWPAINVFKVGFSSVRRWNAFVSRGAEVVRLFEFDDAIEALNVEAWLHDQARGLHSFAFDSVDDRARNALGRKAGGYAECYQGSPEDAEGFVLGAMLRALQLSKEQA